MARHPPEPVHCYVAQSNTSPSLEGDRDSLVDRRGKDANQVKGMHLLAMPFSELCHEISDVPGSGPSYSQDQSPRLLKAGQESLCSRIKSSILPFWIDIKNATGLITCTQLSLSQARVQG